MQNNFKTHLNLRENIQNRTKILKSKKQKWVNFIAIYVRKAVPRNKYRVQDLGQFLITKQPNRWFSYKNRYNNSKITMKKFKFYHGGISKLLFKKYVCQSEFKKNHSLEFLSQFNQRLDVVLLQSKMCFSIENAKQMILHRNVFVNNLQVRSRNQALKNGDFISFALDSHEKIRLAMKKSQVFPFPPKHMIINYKIMSIVINRSSSSHGGSAYFHRPNCNKLMSSRFLR